MTDAIASHANECMLTWIGAYPGIEVRKFYTSFWCIFQINVIFWVVCICFGISCQHYCLVSLKFDRYISGSTQSSCLHILEDTYWSSFVLDCCRNMLASHRSGLHRDPARAFSVRACFICHKHVKVDMEHKVANFDVPELGLLTQLPLDAMKAIGTHNYYNAAVAALSVIGLDVGIDIATISSKIDKLKAPPHRMQIGRHQPSSLSISKAYLKY